MLQSLFKRVGTVLSFMVLLIITAGIGLFAWVSRQQYVEQQLYNLISKEGQRVTIRPDQVSRENRSWIDNFGRTVYLTFTYHNKPYHLRYKADAEWITEADTIALFYHPGIDAFRQPRTHNSFKANTRYSRLIGFTILSMWDDERKWLTLWVGLTCLFILLLSGLLANLTGLTILSNIGKCIFIGMLLAGAAYFTYNTWQYYRYYNQLKSGGVKEPVTVLNTYRHDMAKYSNLVYTYDATVRHGKEEKDIPIEAADYETLKPGDPLSVYYNSRLNDMMSANYTPDHTSLFLTVFIWFMVFFFTRQWVLKLRRRKQV